MSSTSPNFSTLRDAWRSLLSAALAEGAPTAAEAAGKIKALKAANAVEAALQRTGKRSASAEEPVTARIRRRAGEVPVDEPAIAREAAASAPTADLPPQAANQPNPGQAIPPKSRTHETSVSEDLPHRSGHAYRQRIAVETRRKAYQPRLF